MPLNGSFGGFAEQVFELGEDRFDRAQVGRVGRQEEEFGAGRSDGLAHGLAFVAAELVEDDDVAGFERGSRHCSTHTVKVRQLIEWSNTSDALIPLRQSAAMKIIVRQRPCGALPISFLPRCPQSCSGAMLVDAILVDKGEAARIKPALVLLALCPPPSDRRPVLLCGEQLLF